MAIPKLKTFFDSGASPVTGISDGDSIAWRVWDSDNDNSDIDVTFYAYGTWNSAILKVEVSPDNSNWVTAQVLNTIEGTLSDAKLTADGAIKISAPPSSYVRCVISGAGLDSPQTFPALVVKAIGQLVAA